MEMKKKYSHTPERYAQRLRFLAGLLLAMLFFTGCTTDDDEQSNSQQDSTTSAHSEASQSSSEAAADEAESKVIVTPAASSADWNLVLVNRENQLAGEIAMEFYLTESGYPIDRRIQEPYLQLLEAGKAAGMDFTMISGYRSIEQQQANYDVNYQNYLASGLSEEEARTKTEEYIALPNASEHTTGLAVDITSTALANQEGNSGLLPDLENYPEGLWLKENAPKFGFVLRYPKAKEAITGINFEPWHFRYVGVENAMYMAEQNLTLEEYIAILKQNEALGNSEQ
ncbi:M15 family metallopeptidase [Trichococcus pasteurii]|uniref:Peptidase m15b/m15c n=1 Tax=Trichococcus pasteurii TaxID=43064 RepID=A0A1W1IHG3_9LACT|nr:M15 family metallopeptidase [Trichococcus pasteurii]SFE51431.1 D-alanyl-D-alanine carboxypeptidase [Trichococcus pasteurii]SLM52468.1 peptidase m15b/m15c [Trichococcus pasteurii]SSB93349.1 peptidase m15b/m15c [Trichococcus pasteurii]